MRIAHLGMIVAILWGGCAGEGGEGGSVPDALASREAGSPEVAPAADAASEGDLTWVGDGGEANEDAWMGGTGAAASCSFPERDNPNKATVSYAISEASADATVASKTFMGQMPVLVTYNATAKIISFVFGSSVSPCVRAEVTVFEANPPATGRVYTVSATPLTSPVRYLESVSCSSDPNTYDSWSLSMPGTITFTQVDGPNVQIDFALRMGPRHRNKAAGTFTFKGSVKSPCYVIKSS